MYKALIKTFIFISLLLFSFSCFAGEAVLSLEKTKIDINDYINLKLQISLTKGGAVEVSQIKGLENFDIIGQSQSQSSSTKVVVIDGKTKTEIETILNLELTLQAKNKGEFSLGPAILKNNNKEIKSNVVKIEVSGDKLFINNNHLNINTSTTSTTNTNNNLGSNITQTNVPKKEDVVIDTYDNIEKKDFKNNKELYLLFGIISLILILGGYFVLQNKNIFKNSIKNEQNNIKKIDKEEIDFENLKKDIIYPQLTDTDFIDKISDIFKQKLYKKYKIKSIYNKTFDEILKDIDNIDEDIILIVDLINKSKYSNIISDNNKILSLVKKL